MILINGPYEGHPSNPEGKTIIVTENNGTTHAMTEDEFILYLQGRKDGII